MKNLKIFVPFHKEYWKFESDIYTPIQAGKELSDIDLGMLSDNTGENISDKNPYYGELTALYWEFGKM